MKALLETFETQDFASIRSGFAWRIPQRFNMGVACSDQQSPGDLAIVHERRDGRVDRYTFNDLARRSNRLANVLRADGIGPGDRVAVILPQSPETAIAHLAIYKLGAVALPLSSLFGPDALEVRLRDSGARLAITNEHTLSRIEECIERLPSLQRFLLTDTDVAPRPARLLSDAMQAASPDLAAADSSADDPALLIYTSGTTGGPKGALHAQRVLLGHLPGFELSHAFFPKPGDLFWTPADWAWIGGLMDALLPTLLFGRPILVAESQGAFDPEWAVAAMSRHHVRNAFLPPTALKLMRRGDVAAPATLQLRTIMSGGESLGEEILGWTRDRLGVTVNEIFGQTECNYVVGNSSALFPVVPGSMGRPYPGHDMAVLDETGAPASPGSMGEIAIRTPDPVSFLRYWENTEATAAKFHGDWLLTGDLGIVDDAGYLWYKGRTDDVINASGYRVGPTEIENCLMRHAAVAMAAVIGVPDEVRGEVIKACVVPREGVHPDEALAGDLQTFVRSRLAAYQYPRIVEFMAELPLTTTGKIRRAELRNAHGMSGSTGNAKSPAEAHAG